MGHVGHVGVSHCCVVVVGCISLVGCIECIVGVKVMVVGHVDCMDHVGSCGGVVGGVG